MITASQLWSFVYSLEEPSCFTDVEDWIPFKKIKDTEDTDIREKKSITDLDSVTELFRMEGPLGNI